MTLWKKRHQFWLDKFKERRDPPPGGWAKYLNASWMPREEWFPRYRLYLKSTAWANKRAGVLRRAGNKCQLCTATTRLEVHHVRYTNVGLERIEDLRCLCHSCHTALEASGTKYVPMDYALREESARRAALRKRKEEAMKPKTRRIPKAEATPALFERFGTPTRHRPATPTGHPDA